MATPALGATEFLFGFCTACDKEVITHVDLDAAGDLIRRCVHCDALLAGALRAGDADALTAHGYAVLDARTCGNGGGCAAGGCGMRPPRG
jgi:hypothetical protein